MKKLVLILLLLPFALIAQENFDLKFSQDFNDYYTNQIPLKIHLFFNQDEYSPGDTIFFKASIFTARDLSPVGGSTILNVLLKDLSGNLIARNMIRLRNGYGSSQIIIPSATLHGRYVVEAYTNWMENFESSRYFQKYIDIGEQMHITNQVDTTSLKFYPEGGSFIVGLNHKIVVRGKPLSNGKIFNSGHQAVAKFELDVHGLGFFYLVPQPSESYSGKIDDADGFYSLPESVPDGLTLLATIQESTSSLRVIIQMPLTSAFRQKKIYLTGVIHGNIFYEANFEMTDKEYVLVNVPLNDIPSGIAQLALYTGNKTELCRRLFFVPEGKKINVAISLSQKEYPTREKISVTCKLQDSSGMPVRSPIGISVFHTPSGMKTTDRNIVNNLLFYSDLPNVSTGVPPLFESPASHASVDNYLIAQPRIYPLPFIQKQKYFINNIYLTGKVLTKSGRAVPDSAKITFFLQKSVSTYQAYVKDSAFQVFFLMDFYGTEDIFYRVEHEGKKIDDATIVLDEAPTYAQPSLSDSDADRLSFSSQRKRIKESFSFYKKDVSYEEPSPPHSLLEEEVFGADLEIKLSEYILFPTMVETLREVIPMAQHRIIRSKNVVRVFIDELDKFADESPLFVIDGVMTEDVDFFLSLNPSDVSSIKIIYSLDKLNVFGALGKGGIILVETKIPDHADVVPKGETTFSTVGLTESIKFKSAAHLSKRGRMPDLRTALYWNPELVPDENGSATFSFYTTDVTGEFAIRLEGISGEGKPFYQEETFTVKFVPALD